MCESGVLQFNFFLSLLSDNIYIYILTKPENEFPLVFDRPSYVFEVSELRPGKEPTGHRPQCPCGTPSSRRAFPGVEAAFSSGAPSAVVHSNAQLIRVYCISYFFLNYPHR